MAQHVKALATKNDNLRLISGIHMVKWTYSTKSSPDYHTDTDPWHIWACTHAHTHTKINKYCYDKFKQGVPVVEYFWKTRVTCATEKETLSPKTKQNKKRWHRVNCADSRSQGSGRADLFIAEWVLDKPLYPLLGTRGQPHLKCLHWLQPSEVWHHQSPGSIAGSWSAQGEVTNVHTLVS